ncbi:MAG: hypothetical protein QXN75_04210 [Thermoproteota archaeon]|nr:hypothetical protein [Candidatus Brockarchaeota archaeon]
MRGLFDGEVLRIEEAYRFPKYSVKIGNHLYGDVLRVWSEMKTVFLRLQPVFKNL